MESELKNVWMEQSLNQVGVNQMDLFGGSPLFLEILLGRKKIVETKVDDSLGNQQVTNPICETSRFKPSHPKFPTGTLLEPPSEKLLITQSDIGTSPKTKETSQGPTKENSQLRVGHGETVVIADLDALVEETIRFFGDSQ